MTQISNKPTGKIKFIAGQVPTLLDGDYLLGLSQTLTDASGNIKNAEVAPVTQAFSITGPQFALPQGAVAAAFPPANGTGIAPNGLPHIALSRLTLPWERNAGPNPQKPLTPWLLVLAVQAGEGAVEGTQTLNDLQKATTGAVNWPGLTLEPWQDGTQVVAVVDLPTTLVKAIMPQTTDLPFLAHIRKGKNNADETDNEPLAIIMGSRLPAAATPYTAYLVSVEGRYTSKGFDLGNAKNSEAIRFIVLHSWQYSTLSQAEANTDFKTLLKQLNHQPGTLQLANTQATGQGKTLLEAGYVPANHFFRDGSQSVSWYRGPLIPGENPTDPATAGIALPAPSADALLRFWPDLAMFDASYAAAWQLGRLLIVQNTAGIALQLQQWKQTHTQQLIKIEQSALTAHLPLQNFPDPDAGEPDFGTLDAWFTDLSLLKPVPFNYLVPNEQLLPAESIRFFTLDPIWMACLVDGAFSVGSAVATASPSQKQQQLTSGSPTPITGFLLRSQVVAGWPDMQVAAYSQRINDPSQYNPATEQPLPVLRQAFLSDTVLLCLFQGKAKTLDLSKRPDSIHMGVDETNGQYTRPLRNQDGQPLEGSNNQQVTVAVPFSGQASNLVIDISQLATTIAQTVPGFSKNFTAAQFTMEMIEGVDKVRFIKQ